MPPSIPPRRPHAAGARRRRTPIVGALALALIAGLLQVLWLPAQPASAAVSDHRAATWNMNGKPKNVPKIPGMLQKYNLDVLALQEVPNNSKNGTLLDEDGQEVSPIDHSVPNYKPDGTKDSPETTWRVQEFRLKHGVHLYRITTNKNNRGIGFATKDAVENVSTDMHRLKVRGLQSAGRGKKKTPAFPALGVKVDDDWFYSFHATTEAKRGNNNVELALQDFDSFQNSPTGSKSWAVMGDFNRFPSENSPAFTRERNRKRGAAKTKFPEAERAVEKVVNLGAMSARTVYSGDRTQQNGAELDFMVARGASDDYEATRLNSKYGSDHHPVIFTGSAEDPGACDADRTARKGKTAAARRATAAADDSCPLPGLPQATVSMGDSYISGEGGRWQGNANTKDEGSWGTDRAADGTQVYEKNENGSAFCHRSDVAEIKGADIDGVPKERRFNLACSGARTQHVIDEAQGDGKSQGNTSQVEQLAEIAEQHEISTVALSIGGNDLAFSKLVTDCGWDFIKGRGPCNGTAERKVIRDLGQVRANVVETIDAIRLTMAEAGQDQSSYRLVVQSYPAPLPASGEMKYGSTGVDYSRYTQGGCPFYDADADWTRKGAVDGISAMLRGAAEESEASFLDLRDAFDGHELCAKSTEQASSADSLDKPLPAEEAEWVRFHPGLTTPGDEQEALHPNAYGQRALSTCLTKFVAVTGGDTSPLTYSCRGERGSKPDDVDVSGTPAIDAAVRTADDGPPNQYLFRGNRYARFEEGSEQPLGPVKDISSGWSSLRGTPFAKGFDAAFEAEKYDKRQLILFRGDQYVRVEIPMGGSDDSLAKGPLPITTGFQLLEGTPFAKGVDAAMEIGDDRIMLFKGDQMAIFKLDIDGNGDKWVMEPRAISEGLPVLKGTGFEGGVDTAMQKTAFDPEPNGSIVYLVDGPRALRLYLDEDLAKSEIEVGPVPITEMWPSLKGSVFSGEGATSGRRTLRTGPTPADDPEPERPAPSSTDPADQPGCRPDGMTATKGVNTPYCQIYDDKGRELMGERHPRRVVGYFTGWRTGKSGQPMYLPNSIPWGQVSHINYAFAHVGKDSRISVGDTNDPDNPATGMTWPDVPGAEMDDSLPYKGNFNLLNKYKKKHPRVKTLISIGGWAETGGTLKPDGSREKTGGLYTLTNNDDGSVNQPAIDTFADSVVDFLRTYGFDGADIDYEYPTSLKDAGNPEDWPIANARRKGLNAGNTALMKTLREKLDAASAQDGTYYQLTAAASASGYLLRGQQDFRALQYLDFVNSMSYDFHGSWNNFVGPQAPLYDDGKDAELASAGIYDKEKNPEFQQEGYFNTDWSYHYFRGAMAAGRINLGVPYYTRGWKHVKGGTGDGLWGTSELPDQKDCPDGTGTDVSKTPCGAGASGVDNIWHDQSAAGDELAAGSNPMWHAKNLERGVTGGYLGQYGVNPDAPDNRVEGYTRHWDDTLKASWLWNDDKKVFLTTQDEQDIAAKADYIKDKGAGGAMIWELAGDYACPEDAADQCVPGYTLTKQLDESLRDAGPYGATRTGKTELPEQVLDVDVEFADYPTEDLWPLQPELRITNNSDQAIAGGAQVSFDLPTSAPPVVKDGNWQAYENIEPGHSGPNVGGLKGEFHRVTITLEDCQEIPAGRSMDVPVKYFLPATGPANVTLTSEGETFGVTGDKRRGTRTVDPPQASAPCAAPDWDRDADHYNKGDVVTHNGGRWLAQYWANKGDEPGVAPVWRDISPND